MRGTRPDLAFVAHLLSTFLTQPTTRHWNAGLHILNCLKGTRNYTLKLGESSKLTLKGYSDSDWAANSDNRKAITGFIILLGDSVISWSSKKQPTVALSSTEAEYTAFTEASKEAIGLQKPLKGILGPHNKDLVPLTLGDNNGSINLAKILLFTREPNTSMPNVISSENLLIPKKLHFSMYDNLLTKGLPCPKRAQHVKTLQLTKILSEGER